MNNDEKIATKLIFMKVLKDGACDLYDFHAKYRLKPYVILNAIKFLNQNDIITIEGEVVMLRDNINNRSLAIINNISKTDKPDILSQTMLDN